MNAVAGWQIYMQMLAILYKKRVSSWVEVFVVCRCWRQIVGKLGVQHFKSSRYCCCSAEVTRLPSRSAAQPCRQITCQALLPLLPPNQKIHNMTYAFSSAKVAGDGRKGKGRSLVVEVIFINLLFTTAILHKKTIIPNMP